MRLKVNFKVGGRYFIPVNVDLTDGLVNGAMGTLKHIDLDFQGKPITLWMKFDHDDVGMSRRKLLANSKSCKNYIEEGLTPMWKVAKNFPTCRKRLTGRIVMFPLYFAYGFTICKAQGNNHLGIHTIVHLKNQRKIPRREMYVALSRTDNIQNLRIIGSFQDPFFREEIARKKAESKNEKIKLDKITDGYNELLEKKVNLNWAPLYDIPSGCCVISFFNVNSLHCHIRDVCADFSLLASDIVFFLDTRFLKEEKPIINKMTFVDALYMGNDKCRAGGLCLYAKRNKKPIIIKKINVIEKDFFAHVIICTCYDIAIIGVYFSPRCPKGIQNKCLKEALAVSLTLEVIIGGDFITIRNNYQAWFQYRPYLC